MFGVLGFKVWDLGLGFEVYGGLGLRSLPESYHSIPRRLDSDHQDSQFGQSS